VPLWVVAGHKGRLGRPAADTEVASGLLETAVRLLETAGTAVSAVDIEPASDDVPELRSDTVTARVGLATATGTRPVTVSDEYGLALAAVAGAPVRVADAVMGRLAVPVPGEDVLAPFLPPAKARAARGPMQSLRFEPRNMAFTDGLDYWELAGSFSADGQQAGPALGRAVAGLPPGQRQAVTAFYYADQPAGQVAVTPGAAKASLHKARRRLREYITAHRPDLIPAVSRRVPMTAVRIAHADPWPGRTPDGRMDVRHVLVILADDAGHRALPVRLPGPERQLWRLLSRPGDLHQEDPLGGQTEEMTGRLLQAAGVTLTGVTVTDLGPGVTATRIGIAGPGGTRPVTASLADGLTLAVITGAPLAVDEPVMDRLAQPVTGPDLLSQFRRQETPPRSLSRLFEPRNMAFTDGLDRWELRGTFLRQGTGFDYSATAEDGRAILAAAVPQPAGSAFLAQDIDADDYRGRTVTFRAELRAAQTDGRAGLALRAASPGRSAPPRAASSDPREDPANHITSATGTGAWSQYEVTAQVPADASLIRFGVFLNGGGQVGFRHPALAPHPPGQQ
jgi:bifunctional DNase/RNase